MFTIYCEEGTKICFPKTYKLIDCEFDEYLKFPEREN